MLNVFQCNEYIALFLFYRTLYSLVAIYVSSGFTYFYLSRSMFLVMIRRSDFHAVIMREWWLFDFSVLLKIAHIACYRARKWILNKFIHEKNERTGCFSQIFVLLQYGKFVFQQICIVILICLSLSYFTYIFM